MLDRAAIISAPGVYYVNTTSTLAHPVFGLTEDRERFLTLLESVRAVFDARIFAYVLTRTDVHLIVHQRDESNEADSVLRARWRRLGARALPTAARLRARFCSLGGFMQTLLQRFSREWNQRHRSRGRIWASRFRSALLADDRALLAATGWLEHELGGATESTSSRGMRSIREARVNLAPPPLRIGPGEHMFPTDESPPGCSPPMSRDHDQWLERFATAVSTEARAAHGRALRSGWALGRPESLASVLTRLTRGGGRGRGRKLRELDDELGLCGVWG